MDSQIPHNLGLIDLEIEVLFGHNLLIGCVSEGLLVKLIFEVLEDELLFNDAVNSGFNLFNGRDVIFITREGSKSATGVVKLFQVVEVTGISETRFICLGGFDVRLLPKSSKGSDFYSLIILGESSSKITGAISGIAQKPAK